MVPVKTAESAASVKPLVVGVKVPVTVPDDESELVNKTLRGAVSVLLLTNRSLLPADMV